jgi:hypothetical protein
MGFRRASRGICRNAGTNRSGDRGGDIASDNSAGIAGYETTMAAIATLTSTGTANNGGVDYGKPAISYEG